MRVVRNRPRGAVRHLIKATSFFLVGVLMSTLLLYAHTPVLPVSAQVQIENTVSGAFDDPSNPNRPRIVTPGNTTTVGVPAVDSQLLRLTKTADKSAAEPGDVVRATEQGRGQTGEENGQAPRLASQGGLAVSPREIRRRDKIKWGKTEIKILP